MLQPGQEVMVVAGVHNLHDHERLAMAVAKAMRGMSTHDTGSDARFHAKTLTFLDGAVLRDVSYLCSRVFCGFLYFATWLWNAAKDVFIPTCYYDDCVDQFWSYLVELVHYLG